MLDRETDAASNRRPSGPGIGRSVRIDAAPAGPSAARIPELDGLRGIACLVILVYHLKAQLIPIGWMAVDLFFVLSGYLITTILLSSRGKRLALGEFYIRRAQRIWPVYYLTILALAAASRWLPEPCRMAGLPYYLTFTENVPGLWSSQASEFSHYLTHFWSLAIEAQFYLIWPAFVLVGGRWGAGFGAIGLVMTSCWMRSLGFDAWLLVARADGLALGGLLAVVMGMAAGGPHRKRDLRSIFGLIGVVSAIYLAWVALRVGLPRGGRPKIGTPDTIAAVAAFGFAAVGLVVVDSGGSGRAWLRDRRLRWVGKVSFGLYVYHYVVYFLLNDVLDRLGFRGRPVWQDATKLGLTFLMAGLSWRFLEGPILAIGRRKPGVSKGKAPRSESREARSFTTEITENTEAR